MTNDHGNRRDSTGPRGKGWKRCICTIEVTQKEAREYPSTRKAIRKKGNQCSVRVSPQRIKEMGLPICTTHEDQWKRHVAEDEERRKALRNKYDPGPLYEE